MTATRLSPPKNLKDSTSLACFDGSVAHAWEWGSWISPLRLCRLDPAFSSYTKRQGVPLVKTNSAHQLVSHQLEKMCPAKNVSWILITIDNEHKFNLVQSQTISKPCSPMGCRSVPSWFFLHAFLGLLPATPSLRPSSKRITWFWITITQIIHVWYIYLHLGHLWGKC